MATAAHTVGQHICTAQHCPAASPQPDTVPDCPGLLR